MFGQLNEWLFRGLAGIRPDPAGPGFRQIIIRPAVVGDLTEVKASYDSIRGRIVSEWKRSGSGVHYRIVIPPNTTATIELPMGETVGTGRHVGSGEWTFDTPLP